MAGKGKNGITIKQRKWIKAYIETGNATEAAMQVYDCSDRTVAGSIGAENLKKLAIDDLMEEMGLTDVALMNMGIEGATKPVKQSVTGEIHPDYSVRHKYWNSLLNLKRPPNNTNVAVQVNVQPILGGELNAK